MEVLNNWILSIVGVVLIGILIDVILPSGQTSKYIKSIFAIISVFVILSPLPKLIHKDFTFEGIMSENEFILQEDYFYEINNQRLEQFKTNLKKKFEEQGLSGDFFIVSCNIFNRTFSIDKIYIISSNIVIDENLSHINTNEIIIETIKSLAFIKEENIVFQWVIKKIYFLLSFFKN